MSDNNTEALESDVENVDQELDQDDTDQVEDPDVDQDQDDQDDEQEFDRDSILDKLRKKNSENRNLRRAKKEAEEKAEKAGKDSERVQVLEAVNTRYETLAENDLPLKLAKWIDATDAEGILEQAEEILSLGDSGVTPPPTDTPKERVKKNRKVVAPVDEIGDLDEFAAKIYKN